MEYARLTASQWILMGLKPKQGYKPFKNEGFYKRYEWEIWQLEPLSRERLAKIYPVWHGRKIATSQKERAFFLSEVNDLNFIREELEKWWEELSDIPF